MTSEQLLITLLRAILCDEPVTETVTFSEFKAVYKLALKHDLSHLVYTALARADRLPVPATVDERAYLDGVAEGVTVVEYRYVKLEAELTHIEQVFEREGIAYLPLKGAVMRVLYPEPWMRTSCDIDILVHEEDLDRAVTALVDEGFETDGVRNYHDQSLFCDGVHLELHHNVLERRPKTDALLETVWEHTVSKGCQHVETPDFFLFHHVAHMAYHFTHGGCGIRTVMDLWLLRQSGRVSEQAVRDLCAQADLLTFYEQLCRLADYWFGNGEPDELIGRVAEYVIYGGAYGSSTQHNAANAARHGQVGLALHIAFMPYRDLKNMYPSLDGKPWLTPFYQLRRLCQKLLQKRGKSALKRVCAAGRQSAENVAAVGELLTAVGLQE